ncbi:MAG: HD domain-containing protein [Candidatus Pacebacteria bacterium]|nr:HD domain-containing protein [Candidatus Paceibacterota bacterium]
MRFDIPKEVSAVVETLNKADFEAYLVGGCVRDLILNKEPKDWDVTTNAKPEQIQEIFEHTFYENTFGTVGVVNDETTNPSLKTIEVTPYRLESEYSDARRPDSVQFSDKLEDDLKRRDFTMNAIAYDPIKNELVDLYEGQKDIKNKIIKAVGEPEERFGEDALRILRAVRFKAELGFEIEKETGTAIQKMANKLEKISQERIRDEFVKIVMSKNPMKGIELAHELGILKYIIPELEEGIGSDQKGAHIYTIWEHNLRALQHSADRDWPLHVRLAALLHDVGKPATKRFDKIKKENTFYGHEVVGARMTEKILRRLKFSNEIVEVVTKLVRNHLFFSDVDKITLSAVRRIIANVEADRVWELMDVRSCDRIGMGVAKETSYRLKKYHSMIEEAMKDPVSVGMLKINGNDIMKNLKEKPGPKIGFVLHALLEEVLDDPKLNTKEYLEKRAGELLKLPEEELKKLGEAGKEKKDEEQEKEVKEIRKKFGVR